MALDEALLVEAQSIGGPVLRFYGWTRPAASFGYFQRIADVEKAALLRPLVRRPTGGGIVPHDADWTYSVVIPAGHPWHSLRAQQSYRRIHEWVQSAFARLNVATTLADRARHPRPGECFAGHEVDDVLWQGRKVAGAAQRRTRTGLLIQGSVQPPPLGLSRSSWQRTMCEAQPADWREWTPGDRLRRRVEELIRSKHGSEAYQRKR